MRQQGPISLSKSDLMIPIAESGTQFFYQTTTTSGEEFVVANATATLLNESATTGDAIDFITSKYIGTDGFFLLGHSSSDVAAHPFVIYQMPLAGQGMDGIYAHWGNSEGKCLLTASALDFNTLSNLVSTTVSNVLRAKSCNG